MAYITTANFRTVTLAEHCQGLALNDDEAPDTILTNTITRISARVDDMLDDHFEAQNDVVLELDGSGTRRLYLPRRTRGVDAVKTRDEAGALTAETVVWRLHSSLDAAGTAKAYPGAIYDWLDLIPTKMLSTGWVWPEGPQTVQVTGDFGWSVPPAEIKRLVALLVWDQLKVQGDVMRRAERLQTEDASYNLAAVPPEVSDIMSRYRRRQRVPVR